MKFKKILALSLATGMTFGLAACGYEETKESVYTEELMNQAYDTVGFPDVVNYFERSQLKEIYEMRDNPNLVCYWYTKNDMTGKWIYQGRCIGYGIPYTTSMTAPESSQATHANGNYYREVLPLAEPNGLYSSPSTSATWVLSFDDKGNIKPIYVESEISVSQTKMDKRLCEDWSLTEDY